MRPDGVMVPPPPKQPQSIDSPRTHTEMIPAMNTTMRMPAPIAAHRLPSPSSSRTPSSISSIGSP